MEGEVAVERGHYGLEQGAERGGAGDAFARGLEEHGLWCIELQYGLKLFRSKVLDPGFADLGEGCDRRGLGGGDGRNNSRSQEAAEHRERNGGAAQPEE